MEFFDSTIQKLQSSLGYATARNSAISSNIANVDTPNYKAQDVQFKDVLASQLGSDLEAKRTDARHLPFSGGQELGYRAVSKGGTEYNHNGNNVDIDKEMTELAKNQIYYQGLIDRMNGKFKSLQTVLRGGS